jgi:haloalkane dehalogenase
VTEAYRTPDERFAAVPDYPFAPHYLEQDGLRMHYVDEGTGNPVLLLHGEPTWSFMYRHAIARVATVTRAVAPDYFGFGRSDKPLAPDWYSYDAHYRSIERLVDELDLRNLTLVVHDWGGPIGFRLAVERPERVEALVILNTGIAPPPPAWFRFRDFVRRVGPDLSPGRLIRASATTSIPDEVVAAYDAPFPTPRSKAGVLAFPELVPTTPEHPSATALRDVRERLTRWDRPALVLFGAEDPIFPPRAAERLAALLPAALPVETVAHAGHFVAEEAGDEVAERILAFLQTALAAGSASADASA